jgi:hypothetical protein
VDAPHGRGSYNCADTTVHKLQEYQPQQTQQHAAHVLQVLSVGQPDPAGVALVAQPSSMPACDYAAAIPAAHISTMAVLLSELPAQPAVSLPMAGWTKQHRLLLHTGSMKSCICCSSEPDADTEVVIGFDVLLLLLRLLLPSPPSAAVALCVVAAPAPAAQPCNRPHRHAQSGIDCSHVHVLQCNITYFSAHQQSMLLPPAGSPKYVAATSWHACCATAGNMLPVHLS